MIDTVLSILTLVLFLIKLIQLMRMRPEDEMATHGESKNTKRLLGVIGKHSILVLVAVLSTWAFLG